MPREEAFFRCRYSVVPDHLIKALQDLTVLNIQIHRPVMVEQLMEKSFQCLLDIGIYKIRRAIDQRDSEQ